MTGLFQNNEEGILDSLPLAICMLDRQGIVQYTNKAFEDDMGKGFWDGKNKGPGDLMSCVNSTLHPEGCGFSEVCRECRFRRYIDECLEGQNRNEYIEMPFNMLRDGTKEQRWYEIHINSNMLERTGLLLISLRDITFYKRNSLKLLENKKIAEETNRAKSMFLANMSHEIRTPLNGLMGMLDMTLMSDLKGEQRENLEIARNCADILLNLINDILDISKVESNKIELEETRFDIRELVDKIADIHSARVEEKGLEFICNIEESVPAFIKGDGFRLQQVLNNLVSNAVKFTEQGKIQLEAKVLCKSEDSYTITFTVEDTGVGIEQKDMKQLFKLFSQVDGSFTRKYGGTGLGLVISQRLVNLMGGEIKVKSQKGSGSLFYFTIQMKTAEEADGVPEKRVVLDTSEKPGAILVVEDDKTNQVVTRKMLRQMGYQKIDVANDGYEAVSRIEKNKYDIILMDIELPQMDGVETTRIIREKEKSAGGHIPIIAVTAFAQEEYKERFLRSGMDGFVSKPVEAVKLQEELNRFTPRKEEPAREKVLNEVYAAWGHGEREEEKELSAADKRLAFKILQEIGPAMERAEKEREFFVTIEKKAHELKIMAKRKGYKKLENNAFRVELAARKFDLEGVRKRYGECIKL